MTDSMKTPRIAALVIGAALVLAGCNDNAADRDRSPSEATSAGTSAATTSTDPEATIWDPCGIPDSAITALGLNAATKDNKVAGADFPGWKVCSWMAVAKTYDLTIYSSEHTLEEVQQRKDREGFTPTAVGSHRALQYRVVGDKDNLECYISAAVPNGIVDFSVLNRYGAPGTGDPCAEVRRISDALAQYLPKS